MTNYATKCGCNHSLAVIGAAFASAAVIALLAEGRCLDSGGRLSDVAWTCASAAGVVGSLWALVTPGMVGLVVTVVGIPVYFSVTAIGRRWLFADGK